MSEVFKSFLISFLFFAIPASAIILTGAQVIFLMIPDSLTILLIMYALLLGTLFLSTKVLIDTFKNYGVHNEVDYKLLFWLLYIVIAAIITVIEVFIVLIF